MATVDLEKVQRTPAGRQRRPLPGAIYGSVVKSQQRKDELPIESGSNGNDGRRYSFHRLKMKLGAAGGKLYGREKEEEKLRRSYYRAVQENEQELILISGNPGTGKTALANTLRNSVSKEKGFFVAGKFEEQAVCEPYEVFISALTDYTDQFLDASDESRLEEVRAAVKRAVGIEGKLLSDMIPALKHIIPENDLIPQEQVPDNNRSIVVFTPKRSANNQVGQYLPKLYGTAAQNRFRFIFCKFMLVLTKIAPLVLFLDDLQWADTASCELIRNLMHTTDEEKGSGMKLLIIGAHRCDLNPEEKKKEDPTQVVCVACMEMKPFVATMMDLEKERTTMGLRMQNVDLSELDVDAVNLLLSDLLGKTERGTLELAEAVLLQTRGNIFHVLQFVRLLLDQQFLEKNNEDKWRWDLDQIFTSLRSETIMDIVRKTIQELPRLAQEALKVASCMGDDIDDSALDLVLQTPVGSYLEVAAAEGLLVFFPQFGGYRFAHDWIRRTAYEMTPKNEREEFHLKIGRKLWKASNITALQKNIFVIVSLLNKGIKYMKEERERYKVAELNLQAAEKATAVSAFPNASKFSRKGIQLLSRGRWNDYYELTLALFSLAAEVEAINGNYERVVLYIEEVVTKGRCLEDKLRAYAALIRSMGQQDNMEEATSVGVDVLEQLGERVPKPTRINIVKQMIRVKMLLRGKTNSDILQLPLMRNPVKCATLQILNLIFMSSYQARSPYTTLIALRAISITLNFGLHEASSVAFATYAMILCELGVDVKAARRYGEIAISLAENMHSREFTPIVYYLVGSGVTHWSSPIRETFQDLLYASKTAMEVGDAETAVVSRTMKCIHSMYSGTKLVEVKDEIDQCIRTARLYRKQSTETLCLLTLQLIECWMGNVSTPSILTGKSVNFSEILLSCQEAHNLAWVSVIYFFSMDLAYAFGDFDLANTMAESCHEQKPSCLFTFIESHYKEGLTAVAMIRKEINKGKNLKIAKERLKTLTIWSKNSPQTLGPKQLLLDAEVQSLKGSRNKKKINLLYEKAIKDSSSAGFRNEAALALEKFADYKFLCGDTEEALELYSKSVDLYTDWGAMGKRMQLMQRTSNSSIGKESFRI